MAKDLIFGAGLIGLRILERILSRFVFLKMERAEILSVNLCEWH